jgi:hypothetical protein
MLFLAGLTYALFATVHSWSTAVFMGGLIAILGTAVSMIYLWRAKKSRAARWPSFIVAAGWFATMIMLSRDPQPLLATGCVYIATAAAAWGVYLLITHIPAGTAKRVSTEREDATASAEKHSPR